ncbi:hypothetical protein JOD62_002386 [Microbacterium keratanolyticum]|nr:DUF6264 family protein [Microbacterium keratanolyticum]MBM7469838.1 hypothetical protein [Microbacterium keratanolyticum]
MSDSRPQYGEYATPEEQSRRAGRGLVSPAPEAVLSPVPDAVAPVSSEVPAPRRRPFDRLLTIMLLAYGLVTVIMSAISYLDVASVMNESMRMLGIDGEFTNYGQGKIWGVVAGIVLIVGWMLTAAMSVLRLRSGRLTWWVPVAGAVVFTLLAAAALTVPMFGDPAFAAYLSRAAGS